MGFWDLKTLKLDEFRPGIRSTLESGSNLTMAFMEIAPNKEGGLPTTILTISAES